MGKRWMQFKLKLQELGFWEVKGAVTWKAVLNEIYRFSPHQYAHKYLPKKDHELARKAGVSNSELEVSLAFLQEMGLIEYLPNSNNFKLSLEGFRVARENVRQKRTAIYQLLIGIITAIVTFDKIVEVLKTWSMTLLWAQALTVAILLGLLWFLSKEINYD